jgi:type II secretory pathway component PulC
MNLPFAGAYKSSLVLLAANAALLAVLAAEWQIDALQRERFAETLQQKRRGDALFAELPSGDIALGSADDYLDIVNRPLFLEGRLPVESAGEAPPQAAAGNAPSDEFNLSLSGVVLMPGSILALLTDKTGRHFRVKQGESVQGWEVENVQNDKIVVSNGADRKELLLREFKAAKKPPPAAPRGAPVPGLRPPVPGTPPAEHPPPDDAPDAAAGAGGGNSAEEAADTESSGAESVDPETENQ